MSTEPLKTLSFHTLSKKGGGWRAVFARADPVGSSDSCESRFHREGTPVFPLVTSAACESRLLSGPAILGCTRNTDHGPRSLSPGTEFRVSVFEFRELASPVTNHQSRVTSFSVCLTVFTEPTEWREAHGEERRGRRTPPHARDVRRRNLHRKIPRWVRPIRSTGSSPKAIDRRARK
jgi:hypothetical protein